MDANCQPAAMQSVCNQYVPHPLTHTLLLGGGEGRGWVHDYGSKSLHCIVIALFHEISMFKNTLWKSNLTNIVSKLHQV